jgi:hypothetical protein
MGISPSKDRAVPQPHLLEWLKKHKCHVLNIFPLSQQSETKAANEDSFKTLYRLLSEKNIVSISW